MEQKRKIKLRLAAGILGGVLSFFSIFRGIGEVCAQADEQRVTLEKSAVWVSPQDYQAAIDLRVSGIGKYTQKEVPISVIPILDVTDSMQFCETPGHYHEMFYHWVSAFEDASDIWKNIIVPMLPSPEEYAQMGLENADNMFLELPRELDPSGKCRLVCLKSDGEQKDYYSMTHWRIFYVTDDETLLQPLKEGEQGKRAYSHAILNGGIWLPVGTAEDAGGYTAWAYTGRKEQGHGCLYSRMDQLSEGYSGFIRTLFENPGARVCPVAFGGGYYINGWTDNAQEAVDFIAQEKYTEREQALPDHNNGTNYEAALAGAADALERMEKNENTFAILFTDGDVTSGYDHTSGKPDFGRIDPHSYGMPDQDTGWYPTYAQWAVQDSQALKRSVKIYSVGYGHSLDQGDAMDTLQKISSGGEYFIDTRSTSVQTVTDIFRTIYSDIIYKATKVHIVDYISEFWDIDAAKLPEGCKVEEVKVTGQKGQPETIYKLTYPVTREMGADGEEEVQIPVVLRKEYRDVPEKTLYETNQDDPLNKDQGGTGAYVEYVDLDGALQRVSAETPRLDVYPAKADFLLEKKTLRKKIKAGEEAGYEFRLVNRGQAEWKDIRLEDVFSDGEIKLLFDEAEGAELEKDGQVLCIKNLGRGEEKIFTGTAKIAENAQGDLENTVTATAKDPVDPDKEVKKEAKAVVAVESLPMDFEVEKTVDKPQAIPGEILTYKIRIVNTGKRELRSTVATDRFMEADIQAVFQEQKGVVIKKGGTQAVIESILPGQEVVLRAEARIPQDFTEEELINTVLVSPDDGKGREGSDQAKVLVKKGDSTVSGNKRQKPLQKKTVSPTVSPRTLSSPNSHTVASAPRTSYAAGADGKGSTSVTAPKTNDDTPFVLLVVLSGVSGTAALVLRHCRKRRRQ